MTNKMKISGSTLLVLLAVAIFANIAFAATMIHPVAASTHPQDDGSGNGTTATCPSTQTTTETSAPCTGSHGNTRQALD